MAIKLGDYPAIYFYRGKTSDRKFIMSRMAAIPEPKRADIASEYERRYSPERRKEANEWLDSVARGYRDNNLDCSPEIKRSQSKINEVRKTFDLPVSAPENKEVRSKSFLGGLFDEVDKKYRKIN